MAKNYSNDNCCVVVTCMKHLIISFINPKVYACKFQYVARPMYFINHCANLMIPNAFKSKHNVMCQQQRQTHSTQAQWVICAGHEDISLLNLLKFSAKFIYFKIYTYNIMTLHTKLLQIFNYITVQARLTITNRKRKRKRKSHSNGDQVVLKSKNTHCKLWYVYMQSRYVYIHKHVLLNIQHSLCM